MANLTVRNLPQELHHKLRIRAARHGRSMEAEVRAILTQAVLEEGEIAEAGSLQEWVSELYGGQKPAHVADDLIRQRREEAAKE